MNSPLCIFDNLTLRIHVNVDGEEAKQSADIIAAVAPDHAKSKVSRGENGGRLLTHVAVAQEFVKVGKLPKGKIFNDEVQIKLRPNLDTQNLRLIGELTQSAFCFRNPCKHSRFELEQS